MGALQVSPGVGPGALGVAQEGGGDAQDGGHRQRRLGHAQQRPQHQHLTHGDVDGQVRQQVPDGGQPLLGVEGALGLQVTHGLGHTCAGRRLQERERAGVQPHALHLQHQGVEGHAPDLGLGVPGEGAQVRGGVEADAGAGPGAAGAAPALLGAHLADPGLLQPPHLGLRVVPELLHLT